MNTSSTISFEADAESSTLPNTIFNIVTESHPTVFLWSDDSPFSTAMRNYLLTLTSVLQYDAVLNIRSFPRAFVFLIFRNLSVVRLPEFDIAPNPGTRVVLLTNDGRVGQSNKMEFYDIFLKKLVIFKKTKFVWFNVHEGVQQFTLTKASTMETVELSQEEAVHKLKETPRPGKIPNFHGEEIVITLVNNSVYSFLEPVVVNGSSSGWKVEGFQVLLLEMACHIMNLSIVYRASDWYGTFENGSFTHGIYRDLIDNKADASASGAFLRYEAIGLTEFSINWEPNCIRYLVPRPKQLNSSSRIFVYVFNHWFWLAILISVIVSSIIAALAARMSHLPTQKGYRDIWTVIMKMIFHLLQLHYPSRAEYRNALVPLLVTWGWMGFILTAVYSSQLAASFTKPVYTEKIQTERQFIEHGYTFGSPLVFFEKDLLFDMSNPITYKWVTEFYERETKEDRERKMKNGKYVVLGISYGTVFFFREPNRPPSHLTDNYEVADDCNMKKHLGILFSLGSPYLEGMNLISRRLTAGGIIQKFEYDEMMKNNRIPPNVFTLSKDVDHGVQFNQLSLSVFDGPIYLLLLGYLISITVFILHERVYKHLRLLKVNKDKH